MRHQQRQIADLVASMGGDAQSFRRERACKSRAIIAEFCSPTRISALAKELPRYGIAPGLGFDLTVPEENGEPWDFLRPSMRIEAQKLLDEQKPMLLVGTPMCTAFSIWQFINDKKCDAKIVDSEKKSGRAHLAWMCKLYLKLCLRSRCSCMCIRLMRLRGTRHAYSRYCSIAVGRGSVPISASLGRRLTRANRFANRPAS